MNYQDTKDVVVSFKLLTRRTLDISKGWFIPARCSIKNKNKIYYGK